MGEFSYEYPVYAFALKHINTYIVDPLLHTFIPSSVPLLFKLFPQIFDIPFWHLFIGVLTKLLLVVVCMVLSWKITRSTLACVLALMIFFALSDFKIINFNLPMGMTTHIREGMYFSFRQLGILFAITSLILFLDRRFILSVLLLSIGFYFHPLNVMGFF